MKAYDFAQFMVSEKGETSRFGFGIDHDRAIFALKDLACRVERNEVVLNRVHVVSLADESEFTVTRLVLTLHEKRVGP